MAIKRDVFAHTHRGFAVLRWILGIALGILAFVWPILHVSVDAALNAGSTAEPQAVLTAPPQQYDEEIRLARDLAPQLMGLDCRIPIWRAPLDSDFYGIPPDGLEPPFRRALHDAALGAVEQVAAQFNGQCAPKLTAEQLNEVQRAVDLLDNLQGNERERRAVVFYHRAALRYWGAQEGSVRQQIEELFKEIEGDLGAKRQDSVAAERSQGVRAAAYHLRALVNLRFPPRSGGNDVGADLNNALKQFVSLERKVLAKSEGAPVRFSASAGYVVDMSSASAINNLLVVTARAPRKGVVAAIALLEQRNLLGAPALVRSEPMLGANAMLLQVAAPPGPDENLQLKQQRVMSYANAFARPLQGAGGGDDVGGQGGDQATAATARLFNDARDRAALAVAMVGEKPGFAPSTGNPGANSAIRTAFIEGTNKELHVTVSFGPTVIAGGTNPANIVDAWLYFNAWREQIANAQFGKFASSVMELRAARGVDFAPFAIWGSQALQGVRTLIDDPAKRSQLTSQAIFDVCRATTDVSILDAMSMWRGYSCLYHDLRWALVGLWVLGLVIAVCIIVMFRSYRENFAPHHHVERTKTTGPGDIGGGEMAASAP